MGLGGALLLGANLAKGLGACFAAWWTAFRQNLGVVFTKPLVGGGLCLIAAGVLVLLIDAGKAYLAVWLAGKMTANSPFWTGAAAVVVMLGNAYPVFLKFRGGKTVATFVGAFLRLTPVATGAVLLVWLGTAVISRRVSAGSLVAAATFPLGVWLILHPGTELVTASLAAAALIIWRHRDNIRRLRQGAEPAFSLSRKPR